MISETGQKVSFCDIAAGIYRLPANRFAYTPEKLVTVQNGTLSLKLELLDERGYVGICAMSFVKV